MIRRATGIVLTLAVAGCGAEDDATPASAASTADPVARAALKTIHAGAVRYEMHGKAGVPGAPGGAFPVRGSGTVDGRAFRGRSTFTMDIPRVGQTKVEQILDGKRIYMSSPEFEAMTGGKKWLVLQVDRPAVDVDFGALTSQSAVDPTEVLQYLPAVEHVTQTAIESIRGELSKRYDATLDLPGVVEARKKNPVRRAKAKALQRQAGVDELPIRVFVGPGDLVRRLVLRFGAGKDFTIDYIEYGKPVDAQPPPAGEVMDISELGAAANGLGG